MAGASRPLQLPIGASSTSIQYVDLYDEVPDESNCSIMRGDQSQFIINAAFLPGIVLTLTPLFTFFLGSANLILHFAYAFLDFAGELFTLAIGTVDGVIGEVADLVADLALDLVDFAFDAIIIHENAP
jgi:hypothetical protein